MQDESLGTQDFSAWDGTPFFKGYPKEGRCVYIVKSREQESFTAYGAMDDQQQAIFVVQGTLAQLDSFVAQVEQEMARVTYGLPPFDTNTGGDKATNTSRPGVMAESKTGGTSQFLPTEGDKAGGTKQAWQQGRPRRQEVTLQLLLAQAGDGRPVIETPLPTEALLEAPLPEPLPTPTHLYNMSAEPDSLREQRWALVVPDNERGRRLEAILSPLCERRAEEQGRKVDVYRALPGMDAAKAREFVDEEMYPTSRSSREHARYVLLAGTPEELSMELQEELTGDGSCFVGRLPFEREDDYAAYVEKVVAREREAARPRKARAVFLTAQDMSPPVRSGHDFITGPAARRCLEARARGYFPASGVLTEELPAGAKGRLLELAGVKEPSLFFTLSHGVGGPLSGWPSAEEQRRTQGNMWLGDWTHLAAEDVHQGPFLPGGIWFYFACFGAGTPVRSVYQPWMEHLVRSCVMPKWVLEGIERSRPLGARPFIAALPQAALANPKGPLAVIGHLDQAWIYAFHDPRTGQTHANRLEDVLTSLVEGYRVGLALHSLSRFASKADRELRKHCQADAVAESSGQSPVPNMAERAFLWMERHDVTNYTLLGDPAVRLVDRPSR